MPVEPARATQARASLPINPAAEVSAQCDGTQLKLTLNETPRIACVGPLSVVQNGSVRVYRVVALHEPAYRLRIESVGTRVLAAVLGVGEAPDFGCRESDCKGISIGRHDVQGVRVIALNDARLKSAGTGDGTAQRDAVVNGELRTLPEDQVAAAACPGQGVSIVTSDSSASWFCANGGAGFELGDDGNKTYRFTNLDGDSILVAVDQDQRVGQVRYEGDDTLVCKKADCGSVNVSAATANGERTVIFGGATLIETSTGERNVVLSGRLVVPPL